MLWYFLRGSIWEEYTRYIFSDIFHLFSHPLISSCSPKIDAIADKVAHVPLLGLFGALVRDWMPLIDEYYYCS